MAHGNIGLQTTQACNEFIDYVNTSDNIDLVARVNSEVQRMISQQWEMQRQFSPVDVNSRIIEAALLSNIQGGSHQLPRLIRENCQELVEYYKNFAEAVRESKKPEASKFRAAVEKVVSLSEKMMAEPALMTAATDMGGGSIQSLKALFSQQKEAVQGALNEGVSNLSEEILAQARGELNAYREDVLKAQRELEYVAKNPLATPLERATAKASLTIAQNRLSLTQYQKYKQNIKNCGELLQEAATFFHITGVTKRSPEIENTLQRCMNIATGLGAVYDICWNLANYGVAAASSGPLAPAVLIAGGINTLVRLCMFYMGEGGESPPTEYQDLKNDIAGVNRLIQQSHQSLSQMLLETQKLIREKDVLDHQRYLELQKAIQGMYVDFFGRFNQILDQGSVMNARLGELEREVREGFLFMARVVGGPSSSTDTYPRDAEQYLGQAACTNKMEDVKKIKAWVCFYDRVTRIAESVEYSKVPDAAANTIDQKVGRLLEGAAGGVGHLPGKVGNPRIIIEAMQHAMGFGYYCQDFFLDGDNQRRWGQMIQKVKNVSQLIKAIKTAPNFLNKLVDNYKDAVVALQEALRNLKGNSGELRLALRPYTEIGRRISEKERQLEAKKARKTEAEGEERQKQESYAEKQARVNTLESEYEGMRERLNDRLLAIRGSHERGGMDAGIITGAVLSFGLVGAAAYGGKYGEARDHMDEMIRLFGELSDKNSHKLTALAERNNAGQELALTQQKNQYLADEISELEDGLRNLEGSFSEAYRDIDDDRIFQEWLKTCSPAEQSTWNRELLGRDFVDSTDPRDAAVLKVINEIKMQYQRLFDFISLGFRDHQMLQKLIILLKVPGLGRLEGLGAALDENVDYYGAIATGLLPDIEFFRAQLLSTASEFVALNAAGQAVPLDYEPLETLEVQRGIFERFMVCRLRLKALRASASLEVTGGLSQSAATERTARGGFDSLASRTATSFAPSSGRSDTSAAPGLPAVFERNLSEAAPGGATPPSADPVDPQAGSKRRRAPNTSSNQGASSGADELGDDRGTSRDFRPGYVGEADATESSSVFRGASEHALEPD